MALVGRLGAAAAPPFPFPALPFPCPFPCPFVIPFPPCGFWYSLGSYDAAVELEPAPAPSEPPLVPLALVISMCSLRHAEQNSCPQLRRGVAWCGAERGSAAVRRGAA